MNKRGRPFEPGNKFGRGRPRGSRNKRTLLMEELLSQHSDPLLRKALKLALQGNVQMLRLLLDRILARPKDVAVRTGPLPMGTTEELLQSQANIMRKLAVGQLTPSQAEQIDRLIETRRRLLETTELAQRVRAIERIFDKDRDNAA
jgi:hypothetical protein